MSRPKTLKDLLVTEGASMFEVSELAEEVFNPDNSFLLNGYRVRLPDFDQLPDHVQGFIRKAILESTVINALDTVKEAPLAAEDISDTVAQDPPLPKTRKSRKPKS